MLLPFNEISLACIKTPNDIERFYSLISNLVKLLNLKKLPDVVFKSNVLTKDIIGCGNLFETIKESELNFEDKAVLYSIIQNTPFIEEVDLSEIQIQYNYIDSHGLTYAYVKDAPSISIPVHPWLDFMVDAEKQFINADGNIDSEIVSIKHVGDLNNPNNSWLSALLPDEYYSNSAEFITFCEERFERINISSSSLESISILTLEKIKKLERSFTILNEYCLTHWKFGSLRSSSITDMGLHVRPDSEITMQMYGEQRFFRNENNTAEQFTLHFDVSEGERAYIKGLTDDKTIFVAYVGPHLSTKKFPK
ncbi:hypothetical protein KC222_13065 [Cedecea davisae]|uniref:Uncharacterized protein n=1 Tax=Cedecea davisae TaxID=158484 RepID=A0ABS6DJD5_9ENTR|nr:hypothetical protein [Cedecea davisae]MBU4682936.1 hypothetical protein [Cedecea davisae]MBU4687965.1 hypothetical protein [Cedecea davisae]